MCFYCILSPFHYHHRTYFSLFRVGGKTNEFTIWSESFLGEGGGGAFFNKHIGKGAGEESLKHKSKKEEAQHPTSSQIQVIFWGAGYHNREGDEHKSTYGIRLKVIIVSPSMVACYHSPRAIPVANPICILWPLCTAALPKIDPMSPYPFSKISFDTSCLPIRPTLSLRRLLWAVLWPLQSPPKRWK